MYIFTKKYKFFAKIWYKNAMLTSHCSWVKPRERRGNFAAVQPTCELGFYNLLSCEHYRPRRQEISGSGIHRQLDSRGSLEKFSSKVRCEVQQQSSRQTTESSFNSSGSTKARFNSHHIDLLLKCEWSETDCTFTWTCTRCVCVWLSPHTVLHIFLCDKRRSRLLQKNWCWIHTIMFYYFSCVVICKK